LLKYCIESIGDYCCCGVMTRYRRSCHTQHCRSISKLNDTFFLDGRRCRDGIGQGMSHHHVGLYEGIILVGFFDIMIDIQVNIKPFMKYHITTTQNDETHQYCGCYPMTYER
jgi:hypothetical protein